MTSFENLKIKNELPVIALKNVTLFPRIAIPLVVQRSISLGSLEASKNDGLVLFVCQTHADDHLKPGDLYNVGTIGRIISTTKWQDGSVRIDAEGVTRAEILSLTQFDPFIKAKIRLVATENKRPTKSVALMKEVINNFRKLSEKRLASSVTATSTAISEIIKMVSGLARDPEQLIGFIAINISLESREQQELLEVFDVDKALERLNFFLKRELQIMDTERKVVKETKKQLGKMQKEAFLREQLKSIEKELGIDGEKSEMDELRIKIEASKMPKEVEIKAFKELDRLEKMPSFSPEISYIRTYLEWLVDIPWSNKKKSNINLRKAQKILDEDHFGLDKAKERILEFLAVKQSVGKIKGPILCFVGPPGTGKTSIGKSIARAMGRDFVRMSLGGIRDEAEIRGHRRTYVGALPGRIIQGVANAGSKNPVFILDEIDKVGLDFRGDPSAALLEALDPQQNHSFSDHYLEVPFDLSDVMFITTANNLDTIPHALKDRLEVIEFSGYIEKEKFRIAKDFIVPRLIQDHGLKNSLISFKDDAIIQIIQHYTREAGIRDLERQLSKIIRKVTRQMVQRIKKKKVVVTAKTISSFLGPIQYSHQVISKKDEVGIATGLGWSSVGGEILSIEAASMPGKGKLILTGQLGGVMKESAHSALSYARSKTKIEAPDYYAQDIHVNVPSGSVKKDGPSAGITMAMALISLFTGRPIKKDVAMTGEITLRGNVIEIGGVKEKVIAAHRAGLTTVILPKENKKDLVHIPKEVRGKMKFTFVDHLDQAMRVALRK